MIMSWNINNYNERKEYDDDIKAYEDIIRTKDIAYAVERINVCLDFAKEDPAKYDLRSVESAIISYLALDKISNDEFFKKYITNKD